MLNDFCLDTKVQFAQHEFILDGGCGLYWPANKMLIIADLHFEKGSYLVSKGHPLPRYDTHDTLARISALLELYQPENVIALGDNLHDSYALERMSATDFAFMQQLCARVNSWCWIIGNHDRIDFSLSAMRHMEFATQKIVDGITFTHDLCKASRYQVIGHYHPKISVKLKVGKVSGKCFVVGEKILLMPSFGSYTGGLDVDHPLLSAVTLAENAKYYLAHQQKIWRVR